MADKNKLQKIAAAKKKLKEFQSKHKTESINLEENIHVSVGEKKSIVIESAENSLTEYDTIVPADLNEKQQNGDNFYAETMATTIEPEHVTVLADTNQLVQLDQLDQSMSDQNSIQNITTTPDVNAELEKRNQELCTQMWMQYAAMEQMKVEIEKLKMEKATTLTTDLETKDRQLESHLQSIEILVSEKTELANQLSKEQSVAKTKTEEVEELQARLFASRYRGQVLEKELELGKSARERFDDTQQKLCTELENSQEKIGELKKSLDDAHDEVAELKQKLSLKASEIDRLTNELTKIKSEFELSQLKIEQFSAGDQIVSESSNTTSSTRNINILLDERNGFERQVNDLQQSIEQMNIHREQTDQQYQNYVQHLNKESTLLAGQVQDLAADNERLAKRETELTKHVSELEKQIQQQLLKQKAMNELQTNDVGNQNGSNSADVVEFELFKKKRKEFEHVKSTLEQNFEDQKNQIHSLSIQLQEKIDIVADLQNTVEQMCTEQPDSKNLQQAIQSDKIAASRAVAQNQELKLQLDEIQKAYIQLSNDKLELTDRLQSEQHLGNEIRIRFNDMEIELGTQREKLHYKDEEMIRLSHENEELSKQILQETQELDRLRHYEAKHVAGELLHRELLNANETIGKLRLRIKDLEQDKLINDVGTVDLSSNLFENDLVISANGDTNVDDQQHSELENNKDTITTTAINDHSETVSISSTLNIATEQAMDRLQQRFTRTMSEVADLTEEKHRLEHLVMQLQDETETIGEYIALYQNQRRLLKQREIEKDVQLQHIARERESMKESLVRLNNLVVQLLMQHGIENAKELVESVQNNSVRIGRDVIDDNHVHHTNENVKISRTIHADDNRMVAKDLTTLPAAETASEIIRLLSEIKEKNLRENLANYTPEIQHCHCCSGKLETV